MTTDIIRRSKPARGSHWSARPLPEPPRYRRVSRVARRPADGLGQLLEQWLSELRMGYTIAGD